MIDFEEEINLMLSLYSPIKKKKVGVGYVSGGEHRLFTINSRHFFLLTIIFFYSLVNTSHYRNKIHTNLQIHVVSMLFRVDLAKRLECKMISLVFKCLRTKLVQGVYLGLSLIVLNTSGHFNLHGKFLQIYHTSS